MKDWLLFRFVVWLGFNFFAIRILIIFMFQALSFILVHFYCRFLHIFLAVDSFLAFLRRFFLSFFHPLPHLQQTVACSQNIPYQDLFPLRNSTDYLIILPLIHTPLFQVLCK